MDEESDDRYTARFGRWVARTLEECPRVTLLVHSATSAELPVMGKKAQCTEYRIRTYTNGRPGDNLIHGRAFGCLRPESSSSRTGEARSSEWTDIVLYRGGAVPHALLREVYQLSDLDYTWVEGELDVRLTTEGWEALEKWAEEPETTDW